MKEVWGRKLNRGDVFSFDISLFKNSNLKLNDLVDQNFNTTGLITNPTFKIVGIEYAKKNWWKFWIKEQIKNVICECIYCPEKEK